MKIIVAVLNWGLGHASRSIPVIKALMEEGFEPVLASDGEALIMLRHEFPTLRWIELPSYNITYPKGRRPMRLHFLLKSPQILKAVLAEERIIRHFISEEADVGGIISDNRLGAYSNEIPSAYLSHQLKVFSGSTTLFSSFLHQFFINRYSECWIPDLEGTDNLTGKMSHGVILRSSKLYIGLLSRFRRRKVKIKYDLLILLSGPEPQRSYLEEKLLQELKDYRGSVLLVRGKIENSPHGENKKGFEIKNFLTGQALENALNAADIVLARSGYSTIMDLAVLEKKAFFIPTPGQFEQEYLAYRLQEKKIAPFCIQNKFSLKELEKVSSCTGFSAPSFRRSIPGIFALFKGE